MRWGGPGDGSPEPFLEADYRRRNTGLLEGPRGEHGAVTGEDDLLRGPVGMGDDAADRPGDETHLDSSRAFSGACGCVEADERGLEEHLVGEAAPSPLPGGRSAIGRVV